MLINHEINTNIEINTLMDLHKLKNLENESNLKINKSELARELGHDRRTVSKYIDGYIKPSSRKRKSQFDDYYDLIKELLNHPTKVFAYKRVLWQYLKDNHGLQCAQSTFRRYISSVEEFNNYFTKKSSVKAPSPMRFETSLGEQAQLDWKESINFTLKNGEIITINIFVLILSYSRFRIYRLSLEKTRDILCHFLNESFELFGGVPHSILTDNMKTVMDSPRTEYSQGKVNHEFQQFADDYDFKVQPCIAGRPNTKAKVESPMKILDELKAYDSELDYNELIKKVSEINERENSRYHDSYQMIPIMGLEKEKDSLLRLPNKSIRNRYSITNKQVKVNSSSMISYLSNQYSVPPKYINKHLQMQIYDFKIHLYYNKELICIHQISKKRLNYLEEHYIEIAQKTLPFKEEKIKEIAKDNLRKIGEKYEP